MINDPAKKLLLQVELAITVDVGETFVKATYYLEGDGPLVFICYEKISQLRASVSTAYYPSTDAVIRRIANGNVVVHQQCTTYAQSCAQPAYDNFISKFDIDLKATLSAFKAARCFDPSKLTELRPTCCDIDSLRAFPFLNSDSIIDSLKSELPLYM